MIGALVQQQNQNLLRLQQAVEREEGATEFWGSKRGYWDSLYYKLIVELRNDQNDPFSSVVKRGMPLNKLLTPAESTPACAGRRFINARGTTDPTLATVKPTLLQRKL
jgi:hypothetical protein